MYNSTKVYYNNNTKLFSLIFHLNKLTGVGKILYIHLKLNCIK